MTAAAEATGGTAEATGGTGGRAGQCGPVELMGVQRVVMRARFAALTRPRPDDRPQVAELRRVLRDPVLMALVTANVEAWPVLDGDQCATLAALLGPPGGRRP